MKWTSVAAAKSSSSGSAVTTEPRRSIMRARAASMAPRAASPCTADGVARDAVDAASSLGGHRANVPRPPPVTPGLPELQRCGLGGDGHHFTPSTRHVTNSASSPSSAEPRRVPQPPETASAPRAHPPASARGQTIRALPWEDATARFLQLGFEVARRPVRARELSLFASVARFDPRQASQTLNHGFPRWPVHKPSFRKNQQSAARRRLLSAAELRYSLLKREGA